jgi:hypothetical protein
LKSKERKRKLERNSQPLTKFSSTFPSFSFQQEKKSRKFSKLNFEAKNFKKQE